MRRRYTRQDYRTLIGNIRSTIPNVSVSTDVIVGFPGETHEQYLRTVDLVEELQFDKVHSAAYSPREGTIAWRTTPDDVPQEEKERRLKNLDRVQEGILTRKNAGLLGETVEVLIDGRKKGKWQGRTRNDKRVFCEADGDHMGELMRVTINKTSPWSLQGVPDQA